MDLTQSFFELFELPQQYQLDLTLLAERYRELQRLDYLRSVNASVRREELELLCKQRDASLKSLDNAKARVDAVRLLVTV